MTHIILLKQIYIMKRRYTFFNLLILILFFSQVSLGQGWIRNFPLDQFASEIGKDVVQAPNGDFITCGGLGQTYVVRTNVDGDTIWTKRYDYNIGGNGASSLQLLSDGSIVAVARGSSGIVLKLDGNGNVIYSNNWNIGPAVYPESIRSTSDGGFIVAGGTAIQGSGNSNDLFIAKTDAFGDTTWFRSFGEVSSDFAYEVRETTDGGYIVVGGVGSWSAYNQRLYVIKLDANGNQTWEKKHTLGVQQWRGHSIQQTLDGGYIATGNSYDSTAGPNFNSMLVVKMDGNGDVDWVSKPLSSDLDCGGLDVIQNPDSTYMLTGYIGTFSNLFGGFPEYRLPLVKLDKSGNKLWDKYFLESYYTIPRLRGESIKRTIDGGYIIGGSHYDDATISEHMILIKTDSLGNAITTAIQGNVYADLNGNCNWDSLEYPLRNWVVRAVNNNGQTYYANTDTVGFYYIEAELGTYEVTLSTPYPYWDTLCIGSGTVVLDTVFDVDTVNFPVHALVSCPLLNVDISAAFLRLCAASYYRLDYCNWGVLDAQNAYIEVQLDTFLSYDTSAVAAIDLGGNLYRFDLGTVPQGTCGSMWIKVGVLCDTNIMGITHCTEAHIYPDTNCLPSWTGPNIEVEANCLGDSILFRVNNSGGAMLSTLNYNIFEDNVMMRTGGYLLGTGQMEDVYVPVQNGKTYRMEAQQDPNYPALLGDTLVALALEGCNVDSLGNISTGFVTQFSNYDGSPFIDVDCQPNIASYDPNDKRAYPEGYGSEHYIYNYTDLEYYIRFQNTGTDTAFKVVIVDTISPYLDLGSLRVGASSHNYTYEIYGNGIVKFTFDNILLPDSATNNRASQGFIKYKIEQVANNPIGTIINNHADIYFDYNAPIRTNTTFHEIGEDFITVQLLGLEDINESEVSVSVYPNPFDEVATIEISGKDYTTIKFELYDMRGRQIYQKTTKNQQFNIHKADLVQGVYVYRIVADGKLLNAGKLIAR